MIDASLAVPDFDSWFAFKDWADKLTRDERDMVLARCSRDPAYFIHNWVWLLSMPEGWTDAGAVKGEGRPGWTQFRLWDCQRRIIDNCEGHLRRLLIKVRQMGATWLELGRALHTTVFRPNSKGVVISLELGRAEDMSSRFEGMWSRLPGWMRKAMGAQKGEVWSRKEKQFANGSALISMPTTTYSGVSYTLAFAIVDEAALIEQEQRIDLTDIIDVSLDPACDSMGAWISVITTGRLKTGWVWRTVSRIRQKYPDDPFQRPKETFEWMLNFVPVTEHPLWPQDKYDAKLAEADDQELFRRERPRFIDEAFSASGYCVFDVQALRDRHRSIIKKDYPQPREVEFGESMLASPKYKGRVKIYWDPALEERYVAFIDPSEGKATGDSSACVVLGVESGRVAAVLHGKYEDPYELAGECVKLGTYYNVAMLIPEINNDRGLTRRLIELQYPNLYRTRSDEGWVERAKHDRFGWRTNPGAGGSRSKMLASLKHEIRRGWLIIPDEKILQECETFVSTEAKPAGEAGPGAHDDLVMALAGSCYVARMEPDLIPPGDAFSGWEYGGRLTGFMDVIERSRRILGEEKEYDPAACVPWRGSILDEGEKDGGEFDLLDSMLGRMS